MNHIGGLVLAGGRSERMGVPKATLTFGSELLVQRLARIVGEVATEVVVVAASDQQLPPLPTTITIARDRQPNRGPLEAIAAGLCSLNGTNIDVVFITACDAPLLSPAFIRQVLQSLDEPYDAAVPVAEGLPQPLVSAYRPGVLAVVEQMLTDNRLRVLDLLDRIRIRRIMPEELMTVDRELLSLRNVNTPAEYQAALALAGLNEENRKAR